MVVCHTIQELKQQLAQPIKEGQSIGLAPTMGALHIGHQSLFIAARKNQVSVATIFVNPTQFNNSEDFEAYPIDIEGDLEMMSSFDVDIVFVPKVEEIYPEKEKIQFGYGVMESTMEGKYRPGHFSGVGLVLTKLFQIIKPSKAYFGQKDLQQVAIVKKIVSDFFFDLEVVVVPTVRERDGLAASSRNRRLSKTQREEALIFIRTLKKAKDLLNQGSEIKVVKEMVNSEFQNDPSVELEYFEVVDSDSLELLYHTNHSDKISLCIAGYIGPVRLLDNIYLNA